MVRAAVMQGRGEPLSIEELPDPAPGDGQLLVRVSACGICGSDLHIADAAERPGHVLGHEFSGEVVALGRAVDGWRTGERVAVFPLAGCGSCPACLAGRPSRCTSWGLLGGSLPGAYAEYVTVEPRQAFRLPGEVDQRLGALVEPLAVALHAVDKTTRETGQPVLVLGGGPVGQAVAMWARHFGASDVVLSDPVAHRRELARRMGATATVDPTAQDVREAFLEQTGQPPKVVLECVGVPGMIEQAFELCDADGRVTVVGMCIGTDEITPTTAMRKELAAQFVLFYREADFALAIRALERGDIDPSPLVTDVVDLDGLTARFEALKRPTTECKILIEP